MKNKKVVCLGGGIGTVNLIKGLKDYTQDITAVISMADEGGSSGRLRRLYNIQPPGDLVSCMAALAKNNNPYISQLLTYRFPGNRYGKDEYLAGHKLGNLIMVCLRDSTGSFDKAISAFKNIFSVRGKFYPATEEEVSISATTCEGKEVIGEEKIDLGKYNGKRILEKVTLHPQDARAPKPVIDSIMNADLVIAGPGDLYTTILPVLIVKDIANALKKTKAVKIFVVNVANKPFETKGYYVNDYIKAIKNHLGLLPFDKIVVNNNFTVKIPKKFKYQYVGFETSDKEISEKIVKKDLVDDNFPIYHSSKKLAKAALEAI